MKTLREYEISRPWPRWRSRAASAISSESSTMTKDPLRSDASGRTIAAIAAGCIVYYGDQQSSFQREMTHAVRFQRADRRAPIGDSISDETGHGRRSHGLLLRHAQRPCRDPDRHPGQISLQLDR